MHASINGNLIDNELGYKSVLVISRGVPSVIELLCCFKADKVKENSGFVIFFLRGLSLFDGFEILGSIHCKGDSCFILSFDYPRKIIFFLFGSDETVETCRNVNV